MSQNVKCPTCGSSDLTAARRPESTTKCMVCNWSGPLRGCLEASEPRRCSVFFVGDKGHAIYNPAVHGALDLHSPRPVAMVEEISPATNAPKEAGEV